MIRIDLTENAPPVELALPPEVGRQLAASGIVSATPALDSDRWLVGPDRKVGVGVLPGVEIWIKAKIEIAHLVFLLGYAINPKGWRDSPVGLDTAADLHTAVAYSFTRQAERALRPGLLQGYVEREDALPVLRGRIRESAQLNRRFGLVVPLEVRYDDFTVDIAENRLLKTAAQQLLHLPHLSSPVRQQLHSILLRLADVQVLTRGQQLPTWTPTRLNGRYHVALRLAEMVLMARSFTQARGSTLSSSFLFDMPRVFEDFVCVALREALAPRGGSSRLQDSHHLDEASEVRMKPDLVWWSAGKPAAVIDAKYKAEKPAGFPDADLYQMLAYCTALGLPRGHLVYAKGNEQARAHIVRNAGVEIVCHTLDLRLEPKDLLEEIQYLASAIARSTQIG